MMNPINEKNLKDTLKTIDPQKLSKIKNSLENTADLNEILNCFDPKKAQEKLNELHLGENISAEQVTEMVENIKNNPDFLRRLKKNL